MIGNTQHAAAYPPNQGAIDWVGSIAGVGRRPQSVKELQRRRGPQNQQKSWLVLLDCSASTLRQQALSKTLGLVTHLLMLARQQRQAITLMTFAGKDVQRLDLSEAKVDIRDYLKDLRGGGGTPFSQALTLAQQWLKQQRSMPTQIFICTDGRCQWPQDTQLTAPVTVVDMETQVVRLQRCRKLAKTLNARYWHLEQLPEQ